MSDINNQENIENEDEGFEFVEEDVEEANQEQNNINLNSETTHPRKTRIFEPASQSKAEQQEPRHDTKENEIVNDKDDEFDFVVEENGKEIEENEKCVDAIKVESGGIKSVKENDSTFIREDIRTDLNDNEVGGLDDFIDNKDNVNFNKEENDGANQEDIKETTGVDMGWKEENNSENIVEVECEGGKDGEERKINPDFIEANNGTFNEVQQKKEIENEIDFNIVETQNNKDVGQTVNELELGEHVNDNCNREKSEELDIQGIQGESRENSREENTKNRDWKEEIEKKTGEDEKIEAKDTKPVEKEDNEGINEENNEQDWSPGNEEQLENCNTNNIPKTDNKEESTENPTNEIGGTVESQEEKGEVKNSNSIEIEIESPPKREITRNESTQQADSSPNEGEKVSVEDNKEQITIDCPEKGETKAISNDIENSEITDNNDKTVITKEAEQKENKGISQEIGNEIIENNKSHENSFEEIEENGKENEEQQQEGFKESRNNNENGEVKGEDDGKDNETEIKDEVALDKNIANKAKNITINSDSEESSEDNMPKWADANTTNVNKQDNESKESDNKTNNKDVSSPVETGQNIREAENKQGEDDDDDGFDFVEEENSPEGNDNTNMNKASDSKDNQSSESESEDKNAKHKTETVKEVEPPGEKVDVKQESKEVLKQGDEDEDDDAFDFVEDDETNNKKENNEKTDNKNRIDDEDNDDFDFIQNEDEENTTNAATTTVNKASNLTTTQPSSSNMIPNDQIKIASLKIQSEKNQTKVSDLLLSLNHNLKTQEEPIWKNLTEIDTGKTIGDLDLNGVSSTFPIKPLYETASQFTQKSAVEIKSFSYNTLMQATKKERKSINKNVFNKSNIFVKLVDSQTPEFYRNLFMKFSDLEAFYLSTNVQLSLEREENERKVDNKKMTLEQEEVNNNGKESWEENIKNVIKDNKNTRTPTSYKDNNLNFIDNKAVLKGDKKETQNIAGQQQALKPKEKPNVSVQQSQIINHKGDENDDNWDDDEIFEDVEEGEQTAKHKSNEEKDAEKKSKQEQINESEKKEEKAYTSQTKGMDWNTGVDDDVINIGPLNSMVTNKEKREEPKLKQDIVINQDWLSILSMSTSTPEVNTIKSVTQEIKEAEHVEFDENKMMEMLLQIGGNKENLMKNNPTPLEKEEIEKVKNDKNFLAVIGKLPNYGFLISDYVEYPDSLFDL